MGLVLPKSPPSRMRAWPPHGRPGSRLISGMPDVPLSLDSAAFSPLDLSPVLWLDAQLSPKWQESTRSTPATADDDPVGAWDDLSGNGRHAVQATADKRPLLKLAIQNGLPVVRFDGTDDRLAVPTLADASQTIFLVGVKRSASGVASKTLAALNNEAQVYANTGDGTGYVYYANNATAAVSLGGTVTNWTIIELVYASTASVVPLVNGAAGSAFDPKDPYSTSTSLSLGVQSTDLSTFGDYDIGGALVFGSALAAADRAQVRGYYGNHYGIVVA